MTSPTNRAESITMEQRSEEENENTTYEEEKDRYLTLKRELNRLGKAEEVETK